MGVTVPTRSAAVAVVVVMFPCNMSMTMSTCIWAHRAIGIGSLNQWQCSHAQGHGRGTRHASSREVGEIRLPAGFLKAEVA